MGGDLEVESAPGVGSRFRLELLFDPAAAPARPADHRPADGALRILAVEEDALAAAMLRSTLEQLGHRVLLVQDGARALDLLDVGGIDLIMLDARSSGAEAARRIRALGDRARPCRSWPWSAAKRLRPS